MESFQDSIFVSVLLVPSCPLWFSTNQISTIKYILLWAHKQIIWLPQQIQKFQDSICISCTICQHRIQSALDEWNINYQKLSKTITSANNLSASANTEISGFDLCFLCYLSTLHPVCSGWMIQEFSFCKYSMYCIQANQKACRYFI